MQTNGAMRGPGDAAQGLMGSTCIPRLTGALEKKLSGRIPALRASVDIAVA
ncbi:MAG: hypothetical protein J4F47_09130 [Alphaproteobacteria bacterium]|nr:hypothetical protein [Alphaproteobacteria bacterium]